MHITFNDFDDVQNPMLGAGQAHATWEVGRELVKLGHQVTVLCSRYPGSEDRTEQGIEYRHIGLGSQWIKVNNLVYILCLPWSVSRQKTDVFIDCFTAPMSTLCSQLFTKTPVIGLPTSFEAEAFDQKYHLPFSWLERHGAKTYRYFLPYTTYYATKMKRLNHAIQQKIVPEGVGAEYLAIKKTTPTHVLYLGRLDTHQKGLDLLLHAWQRIQHQVNLPLVIAGNGPDELKIKTMIQELGLSDTVQLVGPAFGQKKQRLLATSLVVAFPSRHEGFSLFSLEALASGNALVGFDIPGLSWTNHKAIIKIKPFDVEAYAKALKKIINNPAKAIKLASEAKSLASHYTWKQVATEWHTFISSTVYKGAK